MCPPRRYVLNLRLAIATLSAVVAMTGCVAQPVPAPEANASSARAGDLIGRVIVKFKNEQQADNPALIATLKHDCGVDVSYVRPVGAAGHLYELNGLRDQAMLERAVQALSKRTDVEYAEIDRVMKPAVPTGGQQ